MYHRHLPAPSPQENSPFSLECCYCNGEVKYSLNDLLEHPGWCPGRRDAAAAAAQAAERAARAAEAAQAARDVRRIAAEQARKRIHEAVLEMKRERAAAASASFASASANSASSSPSTSSPPKSASSSSSDPYVDTP